MKGALMRQQSWCLSLLLSIFFSISAAAQWTPSNATTTDSISRDGNVSIGTTYSGDKLNVSGNVRLVGISQKITLGNGQGMRDPGNAGLDLFTSESLTGGFFRFLMGVPLSENMRLDTTGLTLIGAQRQINLGNGQGIKDPGGPDLVLYAASGLPNGWIRLVTGGTSSADRLVISPTGAVTITGSLQVNGDITGAHVFNAVYQDLAEWVPAAEDLQPGTVVVLNGQKNNEVTASLHAYDTMVAGVVSAQPGIILGVAGEKKETVATTGRVRVRVDATKRAVHVGDLLVTSAKPGMAMSSEPVEVAGITMHRPGTILGKALEPLASGEGEILVLLSLQ